MDAEHIFEVLIAFINSNGGTALIVGGLFTWLGKLWATRIIEAEKAISAHKLELVKAELNIKIEEQKGALQLLRERNQRYDIKQFNLYNDLWVKLQDLRFIADALWAKADRDTLFGFVMCLNESHLLVQKSALFLEDDHYRELRELLEKFQSENTH